MTLQRRCIPPSSPSGAPCVGEAVIVKECNVEPCPFPAEGGEGEEEEAEDLPLKIKIMKVSHRPQRYETCIIKEGDLDIVRDDLT